MTAREQYIQQLTDQLASLSSKERADAVEFYNEYIEDAGFTTVKEIVDQLGSPEQLSHEIITKTSGDQSVPADSPLNQENNRRLKKVLYATLVVVLAMILIPLAIELIGIAIGIIGAVLGIGIAAFGTAASLFNRYFGCGRGNLNPVKMLLTEGLPMSLGDRRPTKGVKRLVVAEEADDGNERTDCH